jgi:hypothetical protein
VVAIADFLKGPEVETVDLTSYNGQAGDAIRIIVTDNFAVKTVTVRIFDADDRPVEEGEAQISPLGYEWLFTATETTDNWSGGRVEILASDTPGNVTFFEQNL